MLSNRAFVFRVVGLTFLAFAAIGAFRGEWSAGRGRYVVVTRAGDPASFWRGIIFVSGLGCLSLCLGWRAR